MASGRARRFHERGAIDRATFIRHPRKSSLASPLMPDSVRDRYAANASPRSMRQSRRLFDRVGAVTSLRLHGDCHAGNVLWTDNGPHFVDLDDARSGPAVQDLWMLAPTPRALDALLEGYAEFRDFDHRELGLIGRCASCARSTTRAGSRSAGTIRRFRARFRSPPKHAGGSSTSTICAKLLSTFEDDALKRLLPLQRSGAQATIAARA